RKKHDPSDPMIANSVNVIGYQLMLVGLYTDAEGFMKEAIAAREQMGKRGSYALGNSLSNLGTLYLEEGRFALAKPLLERAIELRKGDPSDKFAASKTQIAYGRLLGAEGKTAEAEVQLKAAVDTLSVHDPAPNKVSIKGFNPMQQSMPVFI